MEEKLKIDMKGNMASSRDSLYFLTLIFKDKCILGFYSRNPWGTAKDQERGWVVINPKTKEVVDTCETYYFGNTGNNFAKWRKKQTKIHGKGTLLLDESDSRWKMGD